MDIHEKIEQLSEQINELARHQTNITKQLIQLMNELEQLKKQAAGSAPKPVREQAPKRIVEPQETIQPPRAKETAATQTQTTSTKPPPISPSQSAQKKTTLEEFIGGNLTSKVGILITIIGIFIGAKYAIEHNLVNPMVRVMMGYVNGLILVGVAIRLKKKYEAYSSVLMGGGLAVLYFITYIAYSFYGMLPQLTAFGLMLVFTVATVYASLVYNRIIIAHLGLVGAYAIPFLLSDESGRYAVLFTYIAIINAGILILSLKKYWKSLFYAAFVLTWVIYSIWFIWQYEPRHFNIAFIFLSVFFIIFYTTFLAYKLIRKEQYGVDDVSILLSNAFIFYGFGYSILDGNEDTEHLLGLFTVVNAVVHLAVSLVIKKLRLADKALFYLLLGLVITFITIAVPVQLDGSWVTLLWTMEAVIIFFIGRTQARTGYEKLAAILSVLAFISLVEDWTSHPGMIWSSRSSSILFNIHFLTGLLVAISQAAILYLHFNRKPAHEADDRPMYLQFYDQGLPFLFLITCYIMFLLEIQSYFRWIEDQPSIASAESEIGAFNACAVILYSMVFVGLVAYINERWIKRKLLAGIAVIVLSFILIVFLVQGLSGLNELASMYYSGEITYFGLWNILLRYVMIATAAIVLALGSRSLSNIIKDQALRKMFGVFIHIAALTIISFEYLNWMGMGDSDNEYKLGLSILWSVYALFLIIMGINKKKKHWRFTGIAFFIITLIKLFTYDLNQTTTISKTVSFISLGAILLLVSYLYNRYKHIILAEDED
ncbi:MAG TPA: DUF2339 domain-containing protein [Chitinophagaceae bacterium]|nr:DUF2339 domain-containing protein [Chitinophagaceae bacterium]